MRIQIIALLLFSSLCHADSISFGDNELSANDTTLSESLSLDSEPVSEPVISEVPELDVVVPEPVINKKVTLIKEEPKKSRLYLGYNLRKGKFYFPQVAVAAEFNSVELIKSSKISNSSFFYDLGIDFMFNKSKAQFYSLLTSVGYEFTISKNLVFNPSLGFALAYYKEQSSIQNVNSIGNTVFVKTGVDYLITENWGINLNFQWSHQMHSKGYWAEEKDSELVLEYITTGVGFVWRFK